jgi:hypothetical protein
VGFVTTPIRIRMYSCNSLLLRGVDEIPNGTLPISFVFNLGYSQCM